MEEKSLTPEEQEALFQVIIRKIPGIKEADKLHELVVQALELMLRRPEDHDLKEQLTKCAHDLFVGARFTPPSKAQDAKKRRMSRDCIELLQAAKEHRPPRDILYPDGVRNTQAAKQESPSPTRKKNHAGKTAMAVAASVLLVAGVVGAVVWQRLWSDQDSIFSEAKQFTDQVIDVATSANPVATKFGGQIKFQTLDGHSTIVATKVPPRICAASGWELVHKGTLTVNGITPRRISSAIITDLCYSSDGNATVSWEPKEVKPPLASNPHSKAGMPVTKQPS